MKKTLQRKNQWDDDPPSGSPTSTQSFPGLEASSWALSKPKKRFGCGSMPPPCRMRKKDAKAEGLVVGWNPRASCLVTIASWHRATPKL